MEYTDTLPKGWKIRQQSGAVLHLWADPRFRDVLTASIVCLVAWAFFASWLALTNRIDFESPAEINLIFYGVPSLILAYSVYYWLFRKEQWIVSEDLVLVKRFFLVKYLTHTFNDSTLTIYKDVLEFSEKWRLEIRGADNSRWTIFLYEFSSDSTEFPVELINLGQLFSQQTGWKLVLPGKYFESSFSQTK